MGQQLDKTDTKLMFTRLLLQGKLQNLKPKIWGSSFTNMTPVSLRMPTPAEAKFAPFSIERPWNSGSK